MSTTTKNYGLIKPSLTDAADITAMNSNWEKIDTELLNAKSATNLIGVVPIANGGTGASSAAAARTALGAAATQHTHHKTTHQYSDGATLPSYMLNQLNSYLLETTIFGRDDGGTYYALSDIYVTSDPDASLKWRFRFSDGSVAEISKTGKITIDMIDGTYTYDLYFVI